MKTLISTLAIVGLCATSASAAVLNYSESASGDLSNNYLAPSTFTLDTAGTNTISGTTTLGPGVIDLDFAALTLGAGLEISNVSLTITNSGLGGLTDATAGFDTSDAAHTVLSGARVDANGGGFLTGSPDFGGPYAGPIGLGALNGSGYVGNSGTAFWDYTWTVTTVRSGASTVPVPASMPLLLGGLACLGGLAHRRKSRGKSRA